MDLTKVQLFADDALIEETYRLGRRVHRPDKYSQPIIVPDRPWEGLGLFLWGTAMYDGGERCFKMWYQTLFSQTEPVKRRYICYATSSDGINWDKPALGRIEFDGSKDNNIVVDPGPALDSPSVVYAPEDEDISRRYKMIYNALWQLPYTPVDFFGDEFWKELQQMHANGKLAPRMSRLYFSPTRPMFELYDLQADPNEFENLVGRPEVKAIEDELRTAMMEWMIRTRDFLPLPTAVGRETAVRESQKAE